MSCFDLVIKDGEALLPDPKNPFRVTQQKADIGIQNGVIKEIGFIENKKAGKIFSAKNLHVLPGLMDCQVHFREPGMEHKENFESGSQSALLGGITGVFEMPNTAPPTTTKTAFEDKIRRAKGRFYCDYAFYIGASPENKITLGELENQPACSGVKIFMGSSTGNLLLDKDDDLAAVLKNGKRRVAVHCEDEQRLQTRKQWIKPGEPSSHALWRDEQTALKATKKLVGLAEKYKRPVHILHVTTQEEIEFLSRYKHIASVEVTPQHLTLFAPSAYEKWGSFVQMNPPIRGKRHYLALWKGLQEGVVDIIGSDHAPHTKEEKSRPYPLSPAGMPGVQTLLPLLLDHAHNKRLDLKTIVRLLAVNPFKKFNLRKRGLIQKEFIANFTLVDLKKEKTITQDELAYKCGWSPFEGMKIKGFPTAVILHGKPAMREGEILEKPLGREIHFES